ncbi:MAG: alpha/beta hydrolase [Acidobacteriota bacterium]
MSSPETPNPAATAAGDAVHTPWTEARFRIERTQDGPMALRRLRPASAPRGTLLYIHGLGESGLCFEALMADPRLAAYDHVVPDLLGYGRSAWPASPRGLAGHAADLEALLLGLDVRGPLTVLGHSMGGVVGLLLASRLPGRFDGLVNVEGNLSPPDCAFSSLAAAYSSADWLAFGRARFLDQLHASAGEDLGREDPQVIRGYAASIEMADPRTFHRGSADLVRESATETLARRLADLGLRQIYLHGRPRGTGDRSLALLDASGIPRRGFEVAGHWPFLDQPDAFAETLGGFLAGGSVD